MGTCTLDCCWGLRRASKKKQANKTQIKVQNISVAFPGANYLYNKQTGNHHMGFSLGDTFQDADAHCTCSAPAPTKSNRYLYLCMVL